MKVMSVTHSAACQRCFQVGQAPVYCGQKRPWHRWANLCPALTARPLYTSCNEVPS